MQMVYPQADVNKTLTRREDGSWSAVGGAEHCVLALDGDKWKVRPNGNYARAGGNGFGINDNGAMYTLNTVDRHIVAVMKGE